MRRGNQPRLRVAADWDRPRIDDFAGAVPLVSLFSFAINLNAHGVVHVAPKSIFNSGMVGSEAIGRTFRNLALLPAQGICHR